MTSHNGNPDAAGWTQVLQQNVPGSFQHLPVVTQSWPTSISKLNWLLSSWILAPTAMSCASLSGTYADFPAKIFIDLSKSCSVLSTQFSCYHNILCNVTSVSGIAHVACLGPVVVPIDGGWFHSQLPFQIKYSSQTDMLLGTDWIVVCHLEVLNGSICHLSQTSLDHLPVGHP